jgi:hypothetical protein
LQSTQATSRKSRHVKAQSQALTAVTKPKTRVPDLGLAPDTL